MQQTGSINESNFVRPCEVSKSSGQPQQEKLKLQQDSNVASTIYLYILLWKDTSLNAKL